MDNIVLAYIDPGSGALLLQALVAGAVGGLTVFRSTFANLSARLFGRRPSDESSTSDQNPPAR